MEHLVSILCSSVQPPSARTDALRSLANLAKSRSVALSPDKLSPEKAQEVLCLVQKAAARRPVTEAEYLVRLYIKHPAYSPTLWLLDMFAKDEMLKGLDAKTSLLHDLLDALFAQDYGLENTLARLNLLWSLRYHTRGAALRICDKHWDQLLRWLVYPEAYEVVACLESTANPAQVQRLLSRANELMCDQPLLLAAAIKHYTPRCSLRWDVFQSEKVLEVLFNQLNCEALESSAKRVIFAAVASCSHYHHFSEEQVLVCLEWFEQCAKACACAQGPPDCLVDFDLAAALLATAMSWTPKVLLPSRCVELCLCRLGLDTRPRRQGAVVLLRVLARDARCAAKIIRGGFPDLI